MSLQTAPPGQRTFRIGTRGSPLALRQADIITDALNQACPGVPLEVVTIRTAGDKHARASLSEIGGRGVFVVELEQALRRGEIDLAVHSLKDLPSAIAEGLRIAAVSPRGDVRDALVSGDGCKLAELPPGATIGTGSPRRAAQLRAYRGDLKIADIRGNVGTRLQKVAKGDYDAVVLAAAGLARLGLLDQAAEVLPLDVMLPCVGQGALALEARADDERAISLAGSIDDAEVHDATDAERAFQGRLGGGCYVAIAALAIMEGGLLWLRGLIADPSGQRLFRSEVRGPAAEAEPLGIKLAEQLLGQGADALLEAIP